MSITGILQTSLQEAISARPLNTVLRSEDVSADEYMTRITYISPLYRTTIPESFDGKSVWSEFLSPVVNQGSCGSCWAVASTSTLADRFNIQSLGLYKLKLSPSRMILCAFPDIEKQISCFGNSLVNASIFLYLYGTTDDICTPYNADIGSNKQYLSIGSFTNTNNLPMCSLVTGPKHDMCIDYHFNQKTGMEEGTPSRFYRALHIYAIPNKEFEIRNEIYNWGPVVSGMKIYSDFYTFNPVKDIYRWDGRSEQVGGHAVEIVGWGELNGIKFWSVKNSWGEQWGDQGYFRILRGVNMCGLEENCVGYVPDFFYPRNFKLNTVITENLREDKDLVEQRELVPYDPELGFSIRVLETRPWRRMFKPVALSKLPDWNTFIAGRVQTPIEHEIAISYNISSVSVMIIICVLIVLTVMIIMS